jgi:ketosteroid isomerase-like protein
MKQCPQCNARYSDEHQFCPQDGTDLVFASTTAEASPTDASPFDASPTEAPPTKASPTAARSVKATEVQPAPTSTATQEPPGNPGNPRPLRLAAIIASLVLLCGTTLFILGSQNGPNTATLTEETLVATAPITQPQGITPSPTAPSLTPTVRADPTQELLTFVENWRSAWQSGDLDSFMGYYNDQIVVDGKQQSRESYHAYHAKENYNQPRREVDVGNAEVHPISSDQATVTFSQHFKGWGRTSDSNWESWGRTRLKLRRYGTTWKITGENFTRSRGGTF